MQLQDLLTRLAASIGLPGPAGCSVAGASNSSLTRLELADCQLQEGDVEVAAGALQQLQSLQALSLRGLKLLDACGGRSLQATGAAAAQTQLLAAVAALPALQELRLAGMHVDQRAFACLQAKVGAQLTALAYEDCSCNCSDRSHSSDGSENGREPGDGSGTPRSNGSSAIAADDTASTSTSSTSGGGCASIDAALQLPGLRSLSLQGNTGVSLRHVGAIAAQQQQLTELRLGGTHISASAVDEVMGQLAALKQLVVLQVPYDFV